MAQRYKKIPEIAKFFEKKEKKNVRACTYQKKVVNLQPVLKLTNTLYYETHIQVSCSGYADAEFSR